MNEQELQTIVAAVIQSLKTNGKTIAQLTPVTSLANSDSLEVSGGKKIAFSKLKELVASAVVVTQESIKSWVVIESTDDLPEEPTPEEQMKAYVLADESTLYVYVGEGGDTLDGSYQSVIMKGAKGNDGVSLGEVVLVNDLTTGGEGNALSAEMGKTLKGLIDSQTFPIVNDLTTGGAESALSAEMGKVLKQAVTILQYNLTKIISSLANLAFTDERPSLIDVTFDGSYNAYFSVSITGVTFTDNATNGHIQEGSTYRMVITPQDGYEPAGLATISVKKDNVEVPYRLVGNALTIENVSGFYEISIVALESSEYNPAFKNVRVLQSGTGYYKVSVVAPHAGA